MLTAPQPRSGLEHRTRLIEVYRKFSIDVHPNDDDGTVTAAFL